MVPPFRLASAPVHVLLLLRSGPKSWGKKAKPLLAPSSSPHPHLPRAQSHCMRSSQGLPFLFLPSKPLVPFQPLACSPLGRLDGALSRGGGSAQRLHGLKYKPPGHDTFEKPNRNHFNKYPHCLSWDPREVYFCVAPWFLISST